MKVGDKVKFNKSLVQEDITNDYFSSLFKDWYELNKDIILIVKEVYRDSAILQEHKSKKVLCELNTKYLVNYIKLREIWWK